MGYILKNNDNHKKNAKLNDAKAYLDKVSKMAKKLGVYTEEIECMKNQSLIEIEKILSIRS